MMKNLLLNSYLFFACLVAVYLFPAWIAYAIIIDYSSKRQFLKSIAAMPMIETSDLSEATELRRR